MPVAGDPPGTLGPVTSDDVVIRAREITRRFGETEALRRVSLSVRKGQIHALLGPNGAGKTTLLRILTGLLDPSEGEVRIGVAGVPASSLAARRIVGLVPSGDRSFYLRLSGVENLLFFGRLHGLRKREAQARAMECIEAVGLAPAARRPVGLYSHGMQKRLSVARGLLMDPEVLFVDEATHDLDPAGAQRVRDLVAAAAARGTAVVWTTQRVDEIRGFVNRVTVLDRGEVRFEGTVSDFLATSVARRFMVRLANGSRQAVTLDVVRAALGPFGAADPSDSEGDYLLRLREDVVLGDALVALAQARIKVLACREERSEVESALLRLTGTEGETR